MLLNLKRMHQNSYSCQGYNVREIGTIQLLYDHECLGTLNVRVRSILSEHQNSWKH